MQRNNALRCTCFIHTYPVKDCQVGVQTYTLYYALFQPYVCFCYFLLQLKHSCYNKTLFGKSFKNGSLQRQQRNSVFLSRRKRIN